MTDVSVIAVTVAAARAVEATKTTRPDVTATEGNALGRLLGSIFDFLIKAVDGLLMVLGVVLGVLASLLPSRRSTRLDVLEALQTT